MKKTKKGQGKKHKNYLNGVCKGSSIALQPVKGYTDWSVDHLELFASTANLDILSRHSNWIVLRDRVGQGLHNTCPVSVEVANCVVLRVPSCGTSNWWQWHGSCLHLSVSGTVLLQEFQNLRYLVHNGPFGKVFQQQLQPVTLASLITDARPLLTYELAHLHHVAGVVRAHARHPDFEFILNPVDLPQNNVCKDLSSMRDTFSQEREEDERRRRKPVVSIVFTRNVLQPTERETPRTGSR